MKIHIKLFMIIFSLLTTPALAASFETQTWQTKNGAHVVYHYAPEIPILDVNIAFAAGSAYDGSQFGLSALTTRLLDQGNGGLRAETVADKFADVGAQYGGTLSQDMIMLSLRTLTRPDALKQATDMFALLISHPDFPTDAFLREKNHQLMSIKQSQESPDTIAQEAFYQALYGQHPYGHPLNGNAQTVNALTIEDIRHFYQQYIVSKNTVIVLVGAIDVALAHQLADQLTHDLPAGDAAQPIPAATALTHAVNINIPHTTSQTVLCLGQLGITHENPDYFPLQVANYILGGNTMVSMLSNELREKRGLTYGVNSEFAPMPGIGPFMISLSTRQKQANIALNVTRDTLTSFTKTGPDEQELTAAKHYLAGSYPVSLGSNHNIANLLIRIAFYHLPNDFLNTYVAHINAVSTADIKRALTHTINPDKLLQITVGRT